MKRNEYKLLQIYMPTQSTPGIVSELLKGGTFEVCNSQCPIKSNNIIIEAQKDACYSIYFRPTFKIVEGSPFDKYFPTVKPLKPSHKFKDPEKEFNTLEGLIDKVEKEIKFVDLDVHGEFGAIIQILKKGNKYYLKFRDKKVN